jgi:hypothetical protein
MLRDSVAPCVKEPIVDNVSGAFEDVRDCPDDEEVVADRHVGDVLHENCPWFQCQDDIDEGSPQLLPGVDLIANAVVDETANLRPSSTAKRLTGGTSGYEVNPKRAEVFDERGHLGWLGHVDFECFAPEVGSVCLQCRRIMIDRSYDRPPCGLNARAKTSRAREEVNGERTPGGLLSPTPSREVVVAWCIRVPRKDERH